MLSTLEDAALPPPDVLLSVRSAKKLVPLGKAGLMSGIHKQPHTGKVQLCNVGVPGDAIDYPYHGGVDKALHQYCAAHYPQWQAEKPEKAHLFKIGSFGENISLEHMNEENVCIGDVYHIGPEVVVQITEPRLPCYKLNARFEWPQAARRVQKTSRIGWYMRILKTGAIQEGDRMVLVERLNPRWNIKNTAKVILDKKVDNSLVEELSKIEGLGAEIRMLANMKLGGETENTMARTKGGAFYWVPYEVTKATMITPRVRELTFEYRGPKDRLITDQMATHAYVNLRFGEKNSIERSYSVVSGDIDKFVLGVALDDNSRGGSKYLHQDLKIGDQIEVSKGETIESVKPPEDFDEKDYRHVFILGGIGVTAFLREIHELREKKIPVEIHYACRSREDASYKDQLPDDCTTYYAKDEGKRLNVEEVVPEPKQGKFDSLIYCCGPNKLLEAVEDHCMGLSYPLHLQNFESFGAPVTGDLGEAFEAIVNDEEKEGPQTISIPKDKSLLDILEDSGFDIPSSCRAGRCGVCVVNVKCGNIKHKGGGLLEELKATSMLSCVSRGTGKIEIEIE